MGEDCIRIPVDSGRLDPEELLRKTGWEGEDLAPAHRDCRWLPYVLRALLHPDPSVQAEAFWDLEPIRHQNTIYAATVPAAEYVAGILSDPRAGSVCLFGKYRWSRDRPTQLRAELIDWLGQLVSDARWSAGQYREADAVLAVRSMYFAAIAPYLRDDDAAVRGAAVNAALILVEADELSERRDEIAELSMALETQRNGARATEASEVVQRYVGPRYRWEDIPKAPPSADLLEQAARVWAYGDPWAPE